MLKIAALVLAGSRGGVDPVAAYAGVSHKGLIELRGVTLVSRVLKALNGAGILRNRLYIGEAVWKREM